MPRYQDQVLDEYGRPVPNASVWVFTAIGDTATLTDDLGLPLVNPVTTDPWGNFYFNCADGYYELNVHWGGEVRYKQTILLGLVPGAVLDGDHGDITVTNLGVTWTIDPNAVTNAKIANSAVTSGKIADGAVGTYQLADNNVTSTKLAPDSVTSAKIADGAVTALEIADGAVANAKIADGAVGTPKIADNAVTTAKIQNDSVDFAKLQNIVTNSIIGRNTAGTGNAEELLPGHVAAMLPVFTSSLNGLAPASGGGTVNYLRADGTWGNPFGAGGGAFVASFNTRTGAVTLLSADVTNALGYTPANDDIVSLAAPGLAPQLPGGNSQYLCADGTWAIPATDVGSVAWGAIIGTLSNQTDLQAALNAKASLTGATYTGNVTIGMGSPSNALTLKADASADRVFMEFFPDSQALTTRGGYLGYITAGSTTLTLKAETGATVIDGLNGVLLRYNSANKLTLSTTGVTVGGQLSVDDEAYGAAWNANLTVPTKNAVYDQIETLTATVNGKANLVGGNTFTGQQILGTGAVTNDNLVVRGGVAEGGQIVLGWIGTSGITTQGNSTWNIDVDANNDFRIYRINAAGAVAVPLTFDEATGQSFFGYPIQLTGDLTASGRGDFTTPDPGEGIRLRATAAGLAKFQVTDNAASVQWGYWNHLADGSATWNGAAGLKWNGVSVATVNPRIQTAAANSVTPTFNDDLVIRTGATATITLNNPTGTAVNGAGIVVRLKDNGTARAISYGSQYRAIGVALPTSTVANKWTYLGMIYNLADVRWDVVSVAQEA